MILIDTGGLYAFLNNRQPEHRNVQRVLATEPGPFVLSPFVLSELDYFVLTRAGHEAELDLLYDVASGAYQLAQFSEADVSEARDVIATYRDLEIGLADASIVVLAGRNRTDRVLTLDERHFRAMRTPQGEPFTILPADA